MRSRKIFAFFIFISVCILSFAGISSAQAPAPPTGEEMLFTTSTSPDALILIDLSGSMDDNPVGGSNKYGNSSCTGTFYSTSGTGHTTDCRKIEIAKRALFAVLDDNNDNVINSSDEGSLKVRVGFMRFRQGDDTAGIWSSGNSRVLCPIGSAYSRIFCANNTSCASTVSSCSNKGCQISGGTECVVGETATGGTPLAMSLYEAKVYLNAHKAADTYADCRQKFVILVSDGSDTYACGGDGQECKNAADAAGYSRRFKGRREVVAQAKALSDAGYKVFVIGFGASMPTYLQNTLNWAAYYGGTDAPNTANTGSTTGYNIPTGCDPNASPPVTTNCCDPVTNQTACYPSGVGTGCLGGYGPLC
ncbi:MAG: VWA domain-containing protein [Deltaproteobacteria bacterium]|nr:VWA domain-containing protein [Deltaproteobacteria bacterium]